MKQKIFIQEQYNIRNQQRKQLKRNRAKLGRAVSIFETPDDHDLC